MAWAASYRVSEKGEEERKIMGKVNMLMKMVKRR